jgi:hypothetical protein
LNLLGRTNRYRVLSSECLNHLGDGRHLQVAAQLDQMGDEVARAAVAGDFAHEAAVDLDGVGGQAVLPSPSKRGLTYMPTDGELRESDSFYHMAVRRNR